MMWGTQKLWMMMGRDFNKTKSSSWTTWLDGTSVSGDNRMHADGGVRRGVEGGTSTISKGLYFGKDSDWYGLSDIHHIVM